jgi:hypothetical protein
MARPGTARRWVRARSEAKRAGLFRGVRGSFLKCVQRLRKIPARAKLNGAPWRFLFEAAFATERRGF